MSIWEELGQKITQSSQEVLQKARDISGVVSMNSDISDSKRKIKDLYAELGEILVKEAFEGKTAEDLRAVIEGEAADEAAHAVTLHSWKEICSKVMYIRSEEEVIALNEAKIEEIKSVKMCPRCGCRITKEMIFCPECGARVAPEAQAAKEPAAKPQAAEEQAAKKPEKADDTDKKQDE